MASRAWALITKPASDRQYGGNVGYADEQRIKYLYDSDVPNSKQVADGDFVILRDARSGFAVAIIESIQSKPGSKTRLRCPVCNTTGIKSREHKVPTWRCNNRHEFSTPTEESVDVTLFEADFRSSYLDLQTPITVRDIKASAMRPSDQLSMEEIALERLEPMLLSASPAIKPLLERYTGGLLPPPTAGDASESSSLNDSDIERQKRIVREILVRRGQAKFRDSLIRRYGARCMVTGCPLLDILEAAHIEAYGQGQNNSEANGLLLRADVHTLFDLNLLAIKPDDLTVHLHAKARVAEYSALEGTALTVPNGRRPSARLLEDRWRIFKMRAEA